MPDASVGPGNAGPQSGQFVNYNRFGQCLDLNSGNYTLGYLILWNCKPALNQAFVAPSVSTSMYTATAGTISMIVAPGDSSAHAGGHLLPAESALDRGVDLPQHGAVQFGEYDSRPAVAAVRQHRGLRHELSDPGRGRQLPGGGRPERRAIRGRQLGFVPVSRIVMRTCSASTLQKWNADPNILHGLPMQYLGEN